MVYAVCVCISPVLCVCVCFSPVLCVCYNRVCYSQGEEERQKCYGLIIKEVKERFPCSKR